MCFMQKIAKSIQAELPKETPVPSNRKSFGNNHSIT